MKTLFLLLLFSISSVAVAQDRVTIDGKLSVPQDGNAEGITVFNEASNVGVVTDAYGNFEIAVAKNEKLAFSSLQYQEFAVIVDQGVIDSKSLTVYVRLTVNVLDEVVVRPYDISGNAEVDVNYIDVDAGAVFEIDSEAVVQTFDYNFTPDRQTKVDNIAVNKGYLADGLNFGNIFRAFIRNKDNGSNANRELPFDADVAVRKMYNDNFFKTYLDIEKKDINSFIFYAEANGLSPEMLKKENELELIEFLIASSKSFKATSEKK